MPRQQEIATLVVNGKEFKDWKTVRVEHRLAEAFHIFMFSAAERPDLPPFWTLEQFKPGDSCQIYLAGILAMDGYITQRQVAYDEDSHSVQLIGKSKTWDLSRSSVDTETGNFDKNPWLAIAKSVAGKFGVGVDVLGNLQDEPFKNVQVSPGEKAFDFLERLARMRAIILGSTFKGNLIAIGDHRMAVTDALVEGVNILAAQVLVQDEFVHSGYKAPVQMSGDDSMWAKRVSRIMEELPGSASRYSPLIVPVEQPGTPSEVRKRVAFEKIFREGAIITAFIKTQGWLRSNDDIWRVGQGIHVKSPMAMLDIPLGLQSAIFEQSSKGGTTTTLELVAPGWLRGHVDVNRKDPSIPELPQVGNGLEEDRT